MTILRIEPHELGHHEGSHVLPQDRETVMIARFTKDGSMNVIRVGFYQTQYGGNMITKAYDHMPVHLLDAGDEVKASGRIHNGECTLMSMELPDMIGIGAETYELFYVN